MPPARAFLCLVAVTGLLAGCTPVTGAATTNSPEVIVTSAAAADPQVLSDVTAVAFPVPGDQRRAMRLDRFMSSVMNVDCGGTPFRDLSATHERRDQAHYADLDLIASKGLVELGGDPTERNATVEDNRCQFTRLGSLPAFSNIEGSWNDTMLSVAASPAVKTEEARAVSCLATQSGLNLKPNDSLGSYFSGVDRAASGTQTESAYQAWMTRASKAFVQCTPDYFAALKAGLEPQRAPAIERNREALTSLAVEVTRAGYVP